MGAARLFLWTLGGLLVIGAAVSLYFIANLSAWVPLSAAVAGVVILVGLLLMGASARTGHRTVVVQPEPQPMPVAVTEATVTHTEPEPFMPVAAPVGQPLVVDAPPAVPADATVYRRRSSSRRARAGIVVEGQTQTDRVVRPTRSGRRVVYERESRTVTKRPQRRSGGTSRTSHPSRTQRPSRRHHSPSRHRSDYATRSRDARRPVENELKP
jgi:hypothetical protein